jgi:hypothetical protein
LERKKSVAEDRDQKHRFKSVLEENAPDHLSAIGLIAIEITNLEHVLGTLLAAIIDAPEAFGQIIYLTPKAAIARLETLENVIAYLLVRNSEAANRLQTIAKRARALIGKRHRIVHGTWGISDGVVSVYGVPPKEDEKPEPYSVERLKRTVSDIRDLVDDIADEIKALRIHHHSIRKKAIEEGVAEATRKPSWRAD